jgi:TolA-binding protein
MKNLTLILLLCIIAISCSPVRSTVDVGSKLKNKSNQEDTSETEVNIAKKNKPARFQDTTFIEIPPVTPPKDFYKNNQSDMKSGDNSLKAQTFNENEIELNINSQSINNEFDAAIKLFDSQKFDEACSKFAFFESTLRDKDSLTYETKYYLAECNIAKNNFIPAINILDGLYENKNIPDNLLEKVIVRLGQIQCAQKKYAIADKFFMELKNRYPESIYNNVANCDFIKKK